MLKPQPRLSEIDLPFWEGCNMQRLMLQHCTACGKSVFYPRACCPFCQADALRWMQASGEGKVISHTTVRRPHHDSFIAEVPYVFAAIRLSEGACMYGQLIDAPTDGCSMIGMAVVVTFVKHNPGQQLAAFVLTP